MPTYQATFNSTVDHILRIGWNVDQGGGNLINGVPAIYDSWESDYNNAGTHYAERHWEYVGSDDTTTRRMLSTIVNQSTNAVQISAAGEFAVKDSTGGNQRFKIGDASTGPVRAYFGNTSNGTYLTVEPNNVTAIDQLNAASNAYISLFKLDNNNVLQVLPAGSYVTNINNDLIVTGSVTLGDTSSDNVTFNARVNSDVLPSGDAVQNLGSSTNRWANVYTGDLHLQNDRGNWTIIEEEEYLTLRNNSTGKVYKLLMELIEDKK
jgi:hypothetical protein